MEFRINRPCLKSVLAPLRPGTGKESRSPFLPLQRRSQRVAQGWTSRKTVCDAVYLQPDKGPTLPARIIYTLGLLGEVVLITVIEVGSPILKGITWVWILA